jgi:hypothetical protein
MPGESAEYDLIRVLDSDSSSKADTFFIAPKEIGRDGSGVQVLTLAQEGEPDAPQQGEQAVFLDSDGSLKTKAPDGTVSAFGGSLDPATTDIDQFLNSDLKADLTQSGGVLVSGQIPTLTQADISDSDTKADLTQAGGVLVSSQIPALSITSVTTVPDQTARLNLTAQEGDVAVQTDTGEAYVLSTNDPTVDSNWIEISIDVLSQIDSQQITPSQVGTSSSPSTVVGDTVTADRFQGGLQACRVSLSVDQSISTAASTKVQYDNKILDSDNNFNTNTHNWVCPETGLYLVTHQVAFGGGSNTDDRRVSIGNANSQSPTGEGAQSRRVSSSVGARMQVTTVNKYQSGDTIAAYVSNGNNSDLVVSGNKPFASFLEVAFLGGL